MEHLIEYEIDIPDLKCSEFPMPEFAYPIVLHSNQFIYVKYKSKNKNFKHLEYSEKNFTIFF